MKKSELTAAVSDAKENTRAALQTVYNTLNKGQRKKVVKDETVKALFDLYDVEYEEEFTP